MDGSRSRSRSAASSSVSKDLSGGAGARPLVRVRWCRPSRQRLLSWWRRRSDRLNYCGRGGSGSARIKRTRSRKRSAHGRRRRAPCSSSRLAGGAANAFHPGTPWDLSSSHGVPRRRGCRPQRDSSKTHRSTPVLRRVPVRVHADHSTTPDRILIRAAPTESFAYDS